MKIVGLDPGLRETGACTIAGAHLELATIKTPDAGNWRRMGEQVVGWVKGQAGIYELTSIGIEDFQFRSPQVSRGMVKHSAEIGKLIGWLVAELERIAPVILVPAHEAQRNTLKGAAAKAAGIPGKNDHERSAHNVAAWLKGTARLAGARA